MSTTATTASWPAVFLGRWAELIAFFVILPLVVGWLLPAEVWMLCLWLAALAAGWRVKHDPEVPVYSDSWHVQTTGWELWRITQRFCASAGAGVLLLLAFAPDRLFTFPGGHAELWLVVCGFYPLISVYPQELLYRRYFLHRFSALFSTRVTLLLANAALFAWMHVIFRNGVAVALCVIGGCFFADTYLRTRSLPLVWFEHSLYGLLVLTIGLGDFFWHGRFL